MFAASKPAATAVAVAGVVALLVFLLVDLPDANAVGTLDDTRQSFFDAEAVPQEGFCHGAGQLARAGDHRDRPGDPDPRAARGAAAAEEPAAEQARRRPRERPKPEEAGATAHKEADDESTIRRLTRRPRARQRG